MQKLEDDFVLVNRIMVSIVIWTSSMQIKMGLNKKRHQINNCFIKKTTPSNKFGNAKFTAINDI